MYNSVPPANISVSYLTEHVKTLKLPSFLEDDEMMEPFPSSPIEMLAPSGVTPSAESQATNWMLILGFLLAALLSLAFCGLCFMCFRAR